MQLTVAMDDWVDVGDLSSDRKGLVFPDLALYRGRAGVYLLETHDRGEVQQWYVGQSGNLFKRMAQYRRASKPKAMRMRKETTDVRIANGLMRALDSRREARLRFLLRVDVQIPERLVDDDDEPLTWGTTLEDTAMRLLAESAVVVHLTESMKGNWEVRNNRLPRRKGTKSAPSPLEGIFEAMRLADAVADGGPAVAVDPS
jgi:predicted GIY-YIG superfamily endonuclease